MRWWQMVYIEYPVGLVSTIQGKHILQSLALRNLILTGSQMASIYEVLNIRGGTETGTQKLNYPILHRKAQILIISTRFCRRIFQSNCLAPNLTLASSIL